MARWQRIFILGVLTTLIPTGLAAAAEPVLAGSANTAIAGSRTVTNPVRTAPSRLRTTSTRPSITGRVQVGQTLSAKPGAWAKGTTLTFRWYADGRAIPGARSKKLTLTAAVAHQKIHVEVTGRKKGHRTEVVTSKATKKVTPAPMVGAIGSGIGTLTDRVGIYGLGPWDQHPNGDAASGRFAAPWTAALYTNGTRLGFVAFDGSTRRLVDTHYDRVTGRKVGAAHTVQLPKRDWPVFGGVYPAPDGNFYVLLGRNNFLERSSLAVIAVRKYSPTWKLTGTAYIYGGASQFHRGIYEPFNAGSASMVLVGDRLVVHTARTLFELDDSLHHQMDFTFEVDTTVMKARSFDEAGGDVDYRFADGRRGFPYPSVSHSFNQLVTLAGRDLVMVDHGDGNPRSIQVSIMRDYRGIASSWSPTQGTSRLVYPYDVFPLAGDYGDNYTGATVTGVAATADTILLTGNSAPQDYAGFFKFTGRQDEPTRNIYLTRTAVATGASTTVWLSSYARGSTTRVGEPQIASLPGGRFAVFWGVGSSAGTSRLDYRLLDQHGKVLASASLAGMAVNTAAPPVVVGSTVYWVNQELDRSGAGVGTGWITGLNLSNPTKPAMLSRAIQYRQK